MDGSVSAALVPSQALSSTGGTNPSNRNHRNRNRNRRRRQQQQQHQQQPETAEAPKSANRRNRNRRKKGNQVGNSHPDAVDSNNSKEDEKNVQPQKTARKRRQAKNSGGRRKRFPWRRHIPPGTVDPITLDPLVSLPYPPFALVATEPYEPVPEWPIPENNNKKETNETEQDRAKRILQEQWGDRAALTKQQQEEETVDKEPSDRGRRHYHLYDGRALAYYVVSQLQFIDPLNRRDLTRAELVHLDNYLERHGFARGNVVQAYDAKGVTLSTAGAAGNTAAGRAEILRQEAQGLLNALFGGSVHPAPTATTPSSSLQQLYAASNQREQQQRNQAPHSLAEQTDEGIYGDDGGMVIIDDDMNPGLRGGGFRSNDEPNADNTAALDASALSFTPGTLWSASHITSQYSQSASVRAQNFPALPSASPAPAPAQHSEAAATTLSDLNKQSKKGPSRSLQRITKVVAKTDPKAVQRQREAREMFVRRAMMSNLAFGDEALPVDNLPPGLPSTITAAPHSDDGPTEGQVLRNQALASALGVAPSTVRASYNSGWARPTTTEFGNELNVSLYPDSLILQARERLTMVLKLEKKWKTFLADDAAASLPLNPMDRPLRTFVHEYSDHWRLHTESFDPEPKRYIHCVKLRDTRLPYPLLSEAARNWRGPSSSLPQQQQQQQQHQQSVVSDTASLKQAAGQTPREEEELPAASRRREMPPPPERQPLPLKPRSLPVPPPGAMFDLADVSEALPKPDTETEAQINSRSGPLFTGRERPKLALAPRTRPLELPPFDATTTQTTYNMAQERQRQELARQEKQRQQEEEQDKKRRILEAAFASSDEEESLASYDSDDWGDEELEPEYASDEDPDLQE